MVSLAGTQEADKNSFAQRFMQRADYLALYPASHTNEAFVDKLIQTTGLTTLNASQMKVDLNSNAKTRQQILREVVESAEMNSREFNNAWVVMQYFGYLRRDGDPNIEYKVWIDYLNQNPTKWRHMINGFLNSTEYRQRFGQP